jgi:hypothetical protein
VEAKITVIPMQSFTGSSRFPKPQILKARTIDPYTGFTTQRARPLTAMERYQQTQAQAAMPAPLPLKGPPVRSVVGSSMARGGGRGGLPAPGSGVSEGDRPRRHQPVPFLAKGGPAKAGMPHIIGEEGPELFIPDQDGQVISHAKLKKVMKQNRRKKPEKVNPFYP